MARTILVLGESGTGKSYSLANMNPKETFLINVFGKALPFRAWRKNYTPIESLNSEVGNMAVVDDSERIVAVLQYAYRRGFRKIIVDDYQFVAGLKTIRDAKIKGYDKFTDIAQGFVKIADICRDMPNDAIVGFLSHVEDNGHGGMKAKTAGRMVDNVIGLESLFTIVLYTSVVDGVYSFETQTNGQNSAKSPVEMFAPLISNDLNFVYDCIQAYDDGEEMPIREKDGIGRRSAAAGKIETFENVNGPLYADPADFGTKPTEPNQTPPAFEKSDAEVAAELSGPSFEQTAVFEDDFEEPFQSSRPLDDETFQLFLKFISKDRPALVSLLMPSEISFGAKEVKARYSAKLSGQYNAVATPKGVEAIEQLFLNFWGERISFTCELISGEVTEFFKKEPTKAEAKAAAKEPKREPVAALPVDGISAKLERIIEALDGETEATAFLVSKRVLPEGMSIFALSEAVVDRLSSNLESLVNLKKGAN